MNEQSISLFSQLSQKDRIGVFKKLQLIECVRLRRTCKWMNSLMESNRRLFATRSNDGLTVEIDRTRNTLEFILTKKWGRVRIDSNCVEDLRGVFFPVIVFSVSSDKLDVFETSFGDCPNLNCELLSLSIGAETGCLFKIIEPKCSFKCIKVDKCNSSFVSFLPQKCRAFATQLMTSLPQDYSVLTRFEYARIHRYSQTVTKDDKLEPFLKKLVGEGPGQLRQFRLPNVSKRVDLRYLELDLIHLHDLDFDAFHNGRLVIKKCSFYYLEIATSKLLFISTMDSYLECHVVDDNLLIILETLLERLQLFRFKSCTLKYSPYDIGSFFDELSASEKSSYSAVVNSFLVLYRNHWDTPRNKP